MGYKILLVDDRIDNNDSLELLIGSYLEDRDIDSNRVEIVSLNSGIDAIKSVLSS